MRVALFLCIHLIFFHFLDCNHFRFFVRSSAARIWVHSCYFQIISLTEWKVDYICRNVWWKVEYANKTIEIPRKQNDCWRPILFVSIHTFIEKFVYSSYLLSVYDVNTEQGIIQVNCKPSFIFIGNEGTKELIRFHRAPKSIDNNWI